MTCGPATVWIFHPQDREAEGSFFNHRFFLPRGKRFECKQRQRREVSSRFVCWVSGGCWGVGGEVGRFAFCVLWPGAGVGAAGGAAPNLIPKPGRRQVSAERDEVPAACGGPSTPGGGRQVKNPTTLVGQRLRLPHCVEVGVGGVWGTARPVRVVRVVANVAEVGGEGGVAVGS